MKPKIHAFNGKTGAGKTTISKKFAKDIGAYRISHDQLLAIMYDSELLERDHSRCCEHANRLAWKIVAEVTALGIDVVIEGWGSRELREQVRDKAEELKLEARFYLVNCPQEERLRRIRKRNEKATEDAPYISDEAFFRMEEIDSDFDEDESFIEIKNIERY